MYSSSYYKSKATGYVFAGTYLYCLNDIFGGNFVNQLIANGDIVECEPPTVIELIKSNNTIHAVRRYWEIHGGTLSEAKKKVDMMIEDRKKFSERASIKEAV